MKINMLIYRLHGFECNFKVCIRLRVRDTYVYISQTVFGIRKKTKIMRNKRGGGGEGKQRKSTLNHISKANQNHGYNRMVLINVLRINRVFSIKKTLCCSTWIIIIFIRWYNTRCD